MDKTCPMSGKCCNAECALYVATLKKGECAFAVLAKNTAAMSDLAKCVTKHDMYGNTYHSFNVDTGN